MTFADIPDGASVFLDANCLVYHFAADQRFGPPCTNLVKRIERKEILAFSSTHVVCDVAHRLMTIEAILAFGWPVEGIAQRLRRHHAEIPKLTRFREAVADVPLLGIQVLPVAWPQLSAATAISRQHELLSGDALIAAMMEHHGLTSLASQDADFDRVPWITRYAPGPFTTTSAP